MTDMIPDLFRSALNFISTQGTNISRAAANVANAAAGAAAEAAGHHPLCGTIVEVGQQRVKIHSLLAEGGFALVFSCQGQDGQWYALKRQIATDQESAAAIAQEIRFAKDLSSHPVIVDYVAASFAKLDQSRSEFSMLSELCSGGTLIELMQRNRLRPDQVMKIFYSLCSAVHFMHDRSPPVTHRDLKIENLLFDAKGRLKLCDFGSATADIFRPDDSWSVAKRTHLEEEMQRFTTPMYRAPEILDTYSNFPIGPSQDIWALGCILYYLSYGRHPFEDSAKLAIVNAKYRLPKEETPFTYFHPIIESLLQPDPYSRPMIGDIMERLEALACAMGVDLQEPLSGLLKDPNDEPLIPVGGGEPAPVGQTPVPPRPPPPRGASATSSRPLSAQRSASNTPPPPRPPPHRGAPAAAPKQADIVEDDEERIRRAEEEYTRRAREEEKRILAAEEEYRQRLKDEHNALRDIGKEKAEKSAIVLEDDPFAIFDSRPQPTTNSAALHSASSGVDLLGDWPESASTAMHRNSSAPSLDNSKKPFDPFADFLAASTTSPSNGPSPPAPSPANQSGRTTPMNRPNVQKTTQQQRKDFESFFGGGSGPTSSGIGPRIGEDAFDDILSSQGFSSGTKNARRTMGDMRRAEEIRDMDPTRIRILDWTRGKERNIRALLSSLNEVLWEGVTYQPPTVAELIPDANVKKYYRKACLVVHPDKQAGQPHEHLARCIFTELNDAWSKFEEDRGT